MAQWGRSDEAVANGEITRGAPIGVGAAVKWDKLNRTNAANAHYSNTTVVGARANTDYNLFSNDTPNAFLNNMAVGVFGASALATTNNANVGAADQPAHAGWVLRRAGTGGIATAVPTATGGGTKFANGETIVLSNGTSNALLTVTTNSQGNITSLTIGASGGTIVGGAGWVNTSVVANTFTRQTHVANIQVSGLVPNTYQNGDVVTISNATGYVAAKATINTLANGSLTNTNCLILTNVGLFAYGTTNTNITMAITNSTGGTAAGNTNTTIMTANFINSSGGAFTLTLGGRAGRVHTETLIAMGSLGVANLTLFGPNSSPFINSTAVNNAHYPDPA